MTYMVTLGNGDTAEADTIPALLDAALTIAEEADWSGVSVVTIAGTPSKPLTAVVRWAVLEAKPSSDGYAPFDWETVAALRG